MQHGDPHGRFVLDKALEDLGTLAPHVFIIEDAKYEGRTTRSANRFIAFTVLDLFGGLQAERVWLRCRWPSVVGDARFTTPAEIQSAIDGYIRLTLAP